MALTARKSLRLEDNGLANLYKKNASLWGQMAKDAYDYTIKGVQKAGEPIRPDDVTDVLVAALEIAQPLRAYLSENGLRQQFWYEWFGEYIIDREWPTLTQTGGQQQ